MLTSAGWPPDGAQTLNDGPRTGWQTAGQELFHSHPAIASSNSLLQKAIAGCHSVANLWPHTNYGRLFLFVDRSAGLPSWRNNLWNNKQQNLRSWLLSASQPTGCRCCCRRRSGSIWRPSPLLLTVAGPGGLGSGRFPKYAAAGLQKSCCSSPSMVRNCELLATASHALFRLHEHSQPTVVQAEGGKTAVLQVQCALLKLKRRGSD